MAKRNVKRSVRRARREAARKRQQRSTYLLLGLLLAAAGGYLFWPRTPAPEVPQARLENNPIYGPADAPVTITEFGDFTCSACKAWHEAGIVFQIVEDFGGSVNLEWRDLPVITADSPLAAEAGQCAHDQGMFWEYLDRVYREPGSSYTNARPDDLPRYAEEIGLDMAAFDACLESGAHRATVNFDLEFGRSLGLGGTPSFLVNGTRVIGGNPELIIQAINTALSSQN